MANKFNPFRGLFVTKPSDIQLGISIDTSIVMGINNGTNQGLRIDKQHAVYTGRVETPTWENKALRVPKSLMPKEDWE